MAGDFQLLCQSHDNSAIILANNYWNYVCETGDINCYYNISLLVKMAENRRSNVEVMEMPTFHALLNCGVHIRFLRTSRSDRYKNCPSVTFSMVLFSK